MTSDDIIYLQRKSLLKFPESIICVCAIWEMLFVTEVDMCGVIFCKKDQEKGHCDIVIPLLILLLLICGVQ